MHGALNLLIFSNILDKPLNSLKKFNLGSQMPFPAPECCGSSEVSGGPVRVLFGEVNIQVLSPFFKCVIGVFSLLSYESDLYILEIHLLT